MKKIKVKKIIKNHIKHLKNKFDMISIKFYAESIHQFRVEHKKMRSLLRTIVSKKSNPKIPSKIKLIYKKLGRIRDMQLLRIYLSAAPENKFDSLVNFIYVLDENIDKLKGEIKLLSITKPFKKSRIKTLLQPLKKYPVLKFKLKIKEKILNLNSILNSENLNEENIHLIRKKLKDIFYNLQVLNKVIKFPALIKWSVLINNKENFYVKLLDELGTFQDLTISIAIIKETRDYFQDQSEKLILAKILKKMEMNKLNLKKQIEDNIYDLKQINLKLMQLL